MKKHHAGTGLLLLAVIVLLCWQNHLLTVERDGFASQLAEARNRMSWLDTQIARLSRPTAAQMAKAPLPAKRMPEDGDMADGGTEDGGTEDENGEIPAGEVPDNPYAAAIPADSLYGPFKPVSIPAAEGRITAAELRRLEDLPPLEVGGHVLKARLLNAKGEQVSVIELPDGQKGSIEFLKEFPYPTAFQSPLIDPDRQSSGKSSSFPVTPSTPTEFEFKNTGWTVDMEMSVQGGLLLVRGRSQQTAFENFTAQPGETGKPIYDDSGTLLTDNKQLQPTFNTRETPFLFDMLPGKTYRLPLGTGDGGAMLELTPVPGQ